MQPCCIIEDYEFTDPTFPMLHAALKALTAPAAPPAVKPASLLAQSAATRVLGALLAIGALWLSVVWAISAG